MHVDIEYARTSLGIELPALHKAAQQSDEALDNYRGFLQEILERIAKEREPEELSKVDVVVLGSIARRESTPYSDCDYYVLQNAASPETTRELSFAAEKGREALHYKQPGARGTFGEIVIAADLYEWIGLEVDSNANMTHRLLLLTESEPVTKGKTHREVIGKILRRYCADYLQPNRKENSPAQVPRYLLNDLVRFWRTMAVDFGTKRWRTTKDDSYLRLAKLTISRKILFAGPLATLLLAPEKAESNLELVSYLEKSFDKPPLAQIASTLDMLSDSSKDALRNLLTNYDDFIKLLSLGDVREVLGGVKGNEDKRDDMWAKCKDIAEVVQRSLEMIFYNDKLFKENIQTYGVF
ncbi:MAG: hypothetical protein ACETWQ_02895 [Phycisphaerae bacterium]